MPENILVALNPSFLHYGITKELQKKFSANYFGICFLNRNALKFIKKQNLIKFNDIFEYPDYLLNPLKEPDYNFLDNFEKKYGIGVWKIIYSERTFHSKYNKYYNFSTKQKLLFLEQTIKFFEELLDKTNPKFFLTQTTIGLADHLLYLLCRKRGIHVLMLRPTRIGYHLTISEDFNFIDSFEKNPTKLNPNFKNFSDLQNYIDGNSSFKQIQKIQTTFQVNRKNKLKSFFQFIFFPNNDNQKYLQNYGKSKLNLLLKGTAVRHKIKKHKVESFFDKYSLKKIPENRFFTYFPLHFEPEKILLVDFPFYDNQIEIIKKISLSLPIKYQLYVKEHPAMEKQAWRDISFYKEILSLPNVKLLHPSINPKEILTKTSLVFTIAGTGGLESQLYGKPSISFSHLEYTDIPSVSYVRSLIDLPEVIKFALSSKVDFEAVAKYIDFLDQNSFEFDYFTINKNFNSTFRYEGFFKDIDYPSKKMESFFNQNKGQYELLANEHFIKIQKFLSENH